jgi:N-acyl-D-amino-acid deacylase
MRRTAIWFIRCSGTMCWLLSLFLLGAAWGMHSPGAEPSLVITGARVADGTGIPLREANVRIMRGRIARIGDFKPGDHEPVIAARGLVLAPGFIDIHNHSDEALENNAAADSQISQGITTVLLGQDGDSPWPIGAYLAKLRSRPPQLNLMMLVGHATLRRRVMGDDYKRAATQAEIAAMCALVEQGMKEGAVGLSSGLEYVIGSYAKTEELAAMARAAAKHGGFYISHIRDEADKSFEAMNEILTIGGLAKIAVQNTHIKLGTVGVWGKAGEVIRMYEGARARGIDVTADCYPYEAWHSNLRVLVPSKRWDDPGDVARALADVDGAKNILIMRYRPDPGYQGRTLEAIARSRGISPVDLYIEMVKNGDATIVGKSMIEADTKAFYQWKWTMVASDGGIGMSHPRGAGTFPRVLGRFVRERKWLALEEAVRKMTSLPAWRMNLKDRGKIAQGYVADLVLFNPDTILDESTFEEPGKLSRGIESVWVNGDLVWSRGAATGAHPGLVLQR